MVQQPALESVLEAQGSLPDVLARLIDSERTALSNLSLQVDALDILHCEEVRVGDGAGIVGGDQVLMGELADNLNLPVKAFDGQGVFQQLGSHDLKGDHPLHVEMTGFEQLAHRPLGKPLQENVGAEHQVGPAPWNTG